MLSTKKCRHQVLFRLTRPLSAVEPYVVGEMLSHSISQRMGETAYILRDFVRRHAMAKRSLVAVEAEESLAVGVVVSFQSSPDPTKEAHYAAFVNHV
jgi:hypothetical protein